MLGRKNAGIQENQYYDQPIENLRLDGFPAGPSHPSVHSANIINSLRRIESYYCKHFIYIYIYIMLSLFYSHLSVSRTNLDSRELQTNKNSLIFLYLPVEIQLFPSPQRFLLHSFLVALQLVRALHLALLFRCTQDFHRFLSIFSPSPPARPTPSPSLPSRPPLFSSFLPLFQLNKGVPTLPILHFRLVGLRLDVLGLRDPIQITPQIVLDLLFLPQFVEVAPRLRLLPLLRELTGLEKNVRIFKIRFLGGGRKKGLIL